MSTLSTFLEEVAIAIESGNTTDEKWETCSKDFPWYPIPWLFKALDGSPKNLEKVALWVSDEMRLHWLLNAIEEEFVEKVEDKPQQKIEGKLSVEAQFVDIGDGKMEPSAKNAANELLPEALILNEAKIEDGLAIDALPTQTPIIKLDEQVELATKNEEAFIQNANFVEKAEEGGEKTEFQVPDLNITTAPKAHPILAFEPMHLVDYFASQGIKLDFAKLPITKMDQQVRSFTQWLKTMKKINFQPDSLISDSVVDAQASASLQEKETITEAMAEVLEKQGKFLKAIGVFEKLILLHPEKSAFFAARIKELREKL